MIRVKLCMSYVKEIKNNVKISLESHFPPEMQIKNINIPTLAPSSAFFFFFFYMFDNREYLGHSSIHIFSPMNW